MSMTCSTLKYEHTYNYNLDIKVDKRIKLTNKRN